MKMLRFRMFVSLILAFLVSIVTYFYLKKDYITVVVAKTDIPPYTAIMQDMVEEKVLPKEYSEFFDGFVCNKFDVVGWASSIKIGKGYPVIKNSEFMFSSKLEDGYLPIGYCIAGIELNRGTILPQKGAIVDLYLTIPSEDGLYIPILKELDNEYPPENLILEGQQNGYVFRNVILHEITPPSESIAGTAEATVIINKRYQDLLICSKGGRGKIDIALKGCASSE